MEYFIIFQNQALIPLTCLLISVIFIQILFNPSSPVSICSSCFCFCTKSSFSLGISWNDVFWLDSTKKKINLFKTPPKVQVNGIERQKPNYKQQHLQQWKKAIIGSTSSFIANSKLSVCSEWQRFFVLRVLTSAKRTQRDCTKFNTLQ